jgi:lysophospholipase L1-like esterase
LIVLLVLLLFLNGCGGGSGSDGSGNNSPVANAGMDQTVYLTGSDTRIITLSGTATDSNGIIVAQQWVPTNGTDVSLSGANTSTATFTVDATERIYTFAFTVTDDDGTSDTDDVSVTVVNNAVPTVDAGEDQIIFLPGSDTQTVTLTGTASDDDGTIVSHQWVQTGGKPVSGLSDMDNATITFTVDATVQIYTFSYTATDDDGAQSTDEVSVMVNPNVPPSADAGVDQTVSLADAQTRIIVLTGTADDSDGTIVEREWTQVDGTPVDLQIGSDPGTATFTVDAATKAYTFAYTVTDDDGAQTTDTVSVYVSTILFLESFVNDDNWSYTDDAGNGDTWMVNSGQLLQSGYNVGRVAASTYQLGTFAVPDTFDTSSTSYRVSVDITPLPNSTGDSQGNDVGIMFRYNSSSGDYYRVALNAKYGYTRFEKYSDGSFETLAVNAIGYVEGQTLNMQAEANGDAIVIWIDYVPIFAIVDATPIAAGTIALYCQDRAQFDNVKVTESSLQPVVAISSPLAYSVALTQDDAAALSVKAVALNMPSGGSIGFTLNDGDEAIVSATDSNGYYATQYTGASIGDHEIMAVLRSETGEPMTSDINSTVGVGGDYYVTIDNSITTGVGDDDDSNNESTDGRIVAIQGFQAPLADLLTDKTGRPQIVFNEAIPGDTAAGVNDKIGSILERHPGANKVLMMIGTNDSNPNGVNLSAAEYRSSIESIAQFVDDTQNRQLWIAKPMPTYSNLDPPILNDTRNLRIEEYNNEIEDLVDDHTNTLVGPDFYNIFLNLTNPTSYYNDTLHPNDGGYSVIADEWHTILP